MLVELIEVMLPREINALSARMFVTVFLFNLIVSLVIAKMGPYVIEVQELKFTVCPKNVSYKVDSAMDFFKREGQTLVRWSLTMPKNDGPLKVRLELELLKNSSFVPVYVTDVPPCAHPLMKRVLTLLGIRTDGKCKLPKGFYSTSDINPDLLAHTMTRVLEYGTLKLIIQWHVPAGFLVCSQVIFSSKPLVRT